MNSAKSVHSSAFLNSLSYLTKVKPASVSIQEQKSDKQLLETPHKSRKMTFDSSESESSDDGHYKSQIKHQAKPKLLKPSAALAKKQTPKHFNLREIPD